MRSAERAIRRRINAELSLGKRLQKTWRSLKHVQVSLAQLFMLSAGGAAIALRFMIANRGAEPPLIFLALVAGIKVVSGNGLGIALRQSSFVRTSAFFPVTDEHVFGKAWRHWLLLSSLLLCLTAPLFAVAGYLTQAPHRWELAAASCIGTWLLLITLEAITTMFPLPGRLRSILSSVLLALAVTVVAGTHYIPAALLEQSSWILLCLPTGWFAGAFYSATTAGPIPPIVYLGCALPTFCALPWAYRALVRCYQIREYFFWEGKPWAVVLVGDPSLDTIPVPQSEWLDLEGEAEPPEPSSESLPEYELGWYLGEHVRKSLYESQFAQASGLIERNVYRLLGRRQRQIAEALLTSWWSGLFHPFQWTRRWLRSLRALGIAGGLISVAPLPNQWNWAGFLVVLACAIYGAPVLGGSWPGLGFEAVNTLNRHCVLPISCSEIARVMLLVNGVRCLAWLPLAALGCIVAAWKADLSAADGVRFAFVGTYLAICGQVIPLILRIDVGSEHRFFTWRMLLTLPSMLLAVVLFAVGGVLLFQYDLVLPWMGSAMVAAGAWLGWVTYRRWYELGSTDVCVQKMG